MVLSPAVPIAEQLKASGGTVPHLKIRLLVDTGAEKTVVERAIAQQLGIPPLRFTEVVGVSQQPDRCPVYRALLELPVRRAEGVATATLAVDVVATGAFSDRYPYHGFLGRDFLRTVLLQYDGSNGTFELRVKPAPEVEPPEMNWGRRSTDR